MNRRLIQKIESSIHAWAEQHPLVELAQVEVYPSEVPDVIHVIVIAVKGFEQWDQSERENDLYRFLRQKLGDTDVVKISLLLTLTEEENENYERIHVE